MKALRLAALMFIFLPAVRPTPAQGCAQCLDSTRATPPQVQAGYRHAIYLLGAAGGVFFLAGLMVFRKSR